MHRLICAFVVRIWHKTHFRMTWPMYVWGITNSMTLRSLFTCTCSFQCLEAHDWCSRIWRRRRKTTREKQQHSLGLCRLLGTTPRNRKQACYKYQGRGTTEWEHWKFINGPYLCGTVFYGSRVAWSPAYYCGDQKVSTCQRSLWRMLNFFKT